MKFKNHSFEIGTVRPSPSGAPPHLASAVSWSIIPGSVIVQKRWYCLAVACEGLAVLCKLMLCKLFSITLGSHWSSLIVHRLVIRSITRSFFSYCKIPVVWKGGKGGQYLLKYSFSWYTPDQLSMSPGLSWCWMSSPPSTSSNLYALTAIPIPTPFWEASNIFLYWMFPSSWRPSAFLVPNIKENIRFRPNTSNRDSLLYSLGCLSLRISWILEMSENLLDSQHATVDVVEKQPCAKRIYLGHPNLAHLSLLFSSMLLPPTYQVVSGL